MRPEHPNPLAGRRPLAAILALSLSACAPSDPDPPPDGGKTTEAVLGGLTVQVTDKPAQITIRTADGEILVEGLAAAARSAYGAAAFRAADFSLRSGLGKFQFTDQPQEDWQGVTAFTEVTAGSDAITFTFAGGSGEIRQVNDGILHVTLSTPGKDRATMAFRCRQDESFLGFGGMAMDIDHRGHTFPVWVTEQGDGRVDTEEPPANAILRGTRHQATAAVPFFLSSAGYGFLADTPRRPVFSLCDEVADAWRYEAWSSDVKFYLFHGPSPLEIIERHSQIVGKPEVVADFAFAPWNDAVRGSDEVKRVAQLIRDNDIASSAIWSEDWAGASGEGGDLFLDHNWAIDRTLYPDMEQMTSDLHDAGFKFLGYFSTFALKDTPPPATAPTYTSTHYAEGVANDYLINNPEGGIYEFAHPRLGFFTSIVDLFDPAARDWMAAFMHAAMDAGIDGWMADYGEWMPIDAQNAASLDGFTAHNQYVVEWHKLNERVIDERTDGEDRLVFMRTAFTGTQGGRNRIMWGADQATSFEVPDGFASAIVIGLGLGVTGFPYYGSDIAGYAEWGSDNTGTMPTAPIRTKELFFRWTTFGAFSPVMRTHHGRRAEVNWSFEDDPETLDHWRRWTKFHTQLYPYQHANATEAARSGAPLMRAMAIDFPGDATVWPLKDQYMFGPQLLIAPVIEEGATSRDVYLPAETWIPLLGGAPVEGPQTVTVDAPQSEIPAFARAGTVLVLLPETIDTLAPATNAGVVTLADVATDREVWAFLGANGTFSESSGGLSYTLASNRPANSDATLAFNNSPLTTCGDTPTPPCGDVDINGREAIVHVVGNGALTVIDGAGTAATLTTSGGAPNRALRLVLRW